MATGGTLSRSTDETLLSSEFAIEGGGGGRLFVFAGETNAAVVDCGNKNDHYPADFE